MFGHDNDTQEDNTTQDTASAVAADTTMPTPVSTSDTTTTPQTPSYDSPSEATITPPATSDATPSRLGDDTGDELMQIKQQALQQLSPLVGHLDQSPEEKFRTTMMMIQASDNQGLIKDAYAAAQQIHDEKTRAQALLDIVNEINYFTQQQLQ
jgi:hypothetical protein